MQISKKEKIMLVILGFVLVGFLYYQFGYQTLVNMVEIKTSDKNDIETKYNKAISTIDSMESQKSKVKILNAKISEEALPLYPTLSQEHLILELDKLIKDSGLEGGMTFEKVEVKGIEEIKKSSTDIDLPDSSMQDAADKYSNQFGDNNKKNNDTPNISNNSSQKSSKDSGTNSIATKKKEDTVTQLKVNVDFNGNYQDVVKFLNALGKYEKKMPVYTINMSTKNLTDVKGSVNMMVYAIPKINDEINDYLIWTLNNTYGKGQPFVLGSAAGTGNKSTDETSDFMVSAKSINSELPTVMIGKANDILRTSYVYGDSNNDEQAEIVLTQSGDKYYYKYKTIKGAMPSNYDGLGNEFTPSGENIVIDVLSESRVTSNDKSGLKLTIVNNTNKLVNVDISGEDVKDPRVSIDGDNKKISINKK